MIDSCDPTIACWSEDGETFVVKDPVKFERSIIPQFFKHSKFSSFVRVSLHALCFWYGASDVLKPLLAWGMRMVGGR